MSVEKTTGERSIPMMKKFAVAFAAVVLCSSGLYAAEVETLEIKNDNAFEQVYGWWRENVEMMELRPGGVFGKDPGGRSGYCMKITNTQTGFVSIYSRALIPTDPATDIFKMSFYVKGKAKYTVGFYTYDKDKKYISTYMDPVTELDSTDWVKKDYTIPGSKLTGPVGFVRIAIELQPGVAEVYFDDFSGIKEAALPAK
ncbi:MAG: hypothetical protein DDT32_01183 [Syntrophomonadaceae bacterium]|nr:hypothetical protein [Bacillota bacterium]MBT9147428.1 hypothetical protein [Bacillota bacterium]